MNGEYQRYHPSQIATILSPENGLTIHTSEAKEGTGMEYRGSRESVIVSPP